MTALRWTPGMRSESGWMVFDDAHGCLDIVHVATGDLDAWVSETLPDALNAPDMTHAGTRGEVLQQARDAMGNPNAYAALVCEGAGSSLSTRFPDGAERTPGNGWTLYRWRVMPGDGTRGTGGHFATEGEAILAALEAA